jgi:hypothetical protein
VVVRGGRVGGGGVPCIQPPEEDEFLTKIKKNIIYN